MPRKTRAQRRQELFDQHFYRVGAAVGAFLRQNPEFAHLKEDLESEGKLRLVDSVERFLKGKVKSLPAYLRLSIWSGLWEAARTDDVIQTPRSCHAQQDRTRDLPDYSKGVAISGRRAGKTTSDAEESTRDFSLVWRDRTEQVDWELLDVKLKKACRDKTDRLIVAMLRTEKNVRSIAKELMLGINKIRARKKAIGERLQELL